MPNTGVGRYSRALVTQAVTEAGLDVFVWTPPAGRDLALRLGVDASRLLDAPNGVGVRTLRSTTGGFAASLQRFDVIHGLKHFIPWRTETPTVLTVHDLFALGSGIRNTPRRFAYARSLRRASLLLPTTLAVEAQIASLGWNSRTTVFLPRNDGEPILERPRGLHAEDFVLHVSDLNDRKNVTVLLDHAEQSLRPRGRVLVLAGNRMQRSGISSTVARLEETGLVVDLGPVSDGELAWLYQNAKALLFPSLMEGYGYPVIEAIEAGCPVVTSDVPALQDIAAMPASVRVLSPNDSESWARYMASPPPRDAVRTRARKRRAPSRQLSDIYASVMP